MKGLACFLELWEVLFLFSCTKMGRFINIVMEKYSGGNGKCYTRQEIFQVKKSVSFAFKMPYARKKSISHVFLPVGAVEKNSG